MVLCGKLVNVVASPHAHDKLRKASEEDLILVVSAMGKFAETYNDFIQPLPGKKILVTASHHKEIHDTLRSSHRDQFHRRPPHKNRLRQIWHQLFF